MFIMADDLIRMTLLRSALADASRFRAGIGGVLKYEQASLDGIRNWEESIAGGGSLDGDEDADYGDYLHGVHADNATNFISLPPGRDFVKGPDWPDINSLQAIYDWHCAAIAQSEQVPVWMVKGAADEASFASSLTSESPSIIEFDAEQEKECHEDRKVLRRVLQSSVDGGRLPKDFFDKYDVKCEGESMISRDSKSETETAIAAVNARLCSRDTAQTQLGFNPKVEKPLIESEMKAEKALGIGPLWEAEQSTTPSGSPETTDGEMTKQLAGGKQ